MRDPLIMRDQELHAKGVHQRRREAKQIAPEDRGQHDAGDHRDPCGSEAGLRSVGKHELGSSVVPFGASGFGDCINAKVCIDTLRPTKHFRDHAPDSASVLHDARQ